MKFKKGIGNICIFCIVVYKFYYKQEFCFVTLLLIDKCLKIGLYYAILILDLAICLKIKYGRKLSIDVEKVA